LGISRLAAWGLSGGGPHVLACAALLPDLIASAASIGSVAPFRANGLDWFEGMGQSNIDGFLLAADDPAAYRERVRKGREAVLASSAEDLRTAWASVLSPADATVLTGELTQYLKLTHDEGLAPGFEGWADDFLAFVAPWEFSMSDITVPVLVVQGRQDRFVPFGHGAWLASAIPGAEAWLLDDEGHLTLVETRMDDVHRWLLSRLRG
jgi:pimeloyl-ACP methyl ester carboxylesterase